MSHAILDAAGLRWWTEAELMHRDLVVSNCAATIRKALLGMNKAWTFHRTEAPMIVPRDMVAPGYDSADLWMLQAQLLGGEATMRPETTAGSYAEARRIMGNSRKVLPMAVWQVGKSFRRETNDGASASKLRFFEFTQAEWQCLYAVGTLADYRAAVVPQVERILGWLSNSETRIVPSDRLPAYSERTDDVEVKRGNRWTEVASISTRTDFDDETRVLEIAIGVDRVVDIAAETGLLGQ